MKKRSTEAQALPKRPKLSKSEEKAVQRVLRFSEHWLHCFRECSNGSTSTRNLVLGMDWWQDAYHELSTEHFLPGHSLKEHGRAYREPEDSWLLEADQLVRVETFSDQAQVETRSGKYFYEFHLKRSGRNWLIADIQRYWAAKNDPMLSEEERRRLAQRSRLDAKLPPMFPEDSPDPSSQFVHGRAVLAFDRQERHLEVRRIGEIYLKSGRIALQDFGGRDLSRPLTRSLPPGVYPVEVTLIGKTPTAARLLFRPDVPVAEWRLAVTDPQDPYSYGVGVDSGSVSFFDVDAFGECSKRESHRIWKDTRLGSGKDPAFFVTLKNRGKGDGDCFVVQSGAGDGYYPSYWGLSAQGESVCLMVDFQLEEFWLSIPWSSDLLGQAVKHPALQKAEVRIVGHGKSKQGLNYRLPGFEVEGEAFMSGRLVDSDGTVLWQAYGEDVLQFFEADENLDEVHSATLEIQLDGPMDPELDQA